VGCDNEECEFEEWYHKRCLKSAQGNPSNEYNKPPAARQKLWYCTPKCASKVQDCKYQYSRSIIFAGLNHEAFKSAIRANDGKRMKLYHKLHMVQLFNQGHDMYLRIYHRMLATMENGKPHVVHDLMYNSTVNCRGYYGGNLSLDFVNELLNKVLKGT
jgi:hypothetical protein